MGRIQRILLFGLVLFAGLCFSPVAAYADGIIIIYPPHHRPPRPHPRPMPRPIPRPPVLIPLAVNWHRVNVEIKDQVATTKIDQEFYNPNGRELEGEYIFPIPEDAAFKEFSMWMGGKEVKGEILDADKARQIYMDIVRRKKDPALLEYVGRDMFRAKVFPIPARGTVRIKLEYSEALTKDFDLTTYRYPLNTEKFSSAPLKEVAVSVKIISDKPLVNVQSPTHKVDVNIKNGVVATVSFEERNVLPDRDFVVYYGTTQKEVGLDLRSHTRVGEDGYFLMLISPATDDKKTKIVNKDVVFVFDTSGSMRGDKLKQEIAALKFGVQGLREGDRFNLVSFASGIRTFRDNLIEHSDQAIKEALSWLDEHSATGGTDINGALLEALKLQDKSDKKRPFMIVFLTDGEPTVGETTEPDLIIRNVAKANENKVRIFCFGIGSKLDVHLIDRLAEENSGAHSYVSETENIEVKASNFFEKVSSPVLADVKVTPASGLTLYDTYPAKLRDLFRGGQVQVFGRYKGEGTKAITLTGYVNGEKKTFTFEEKFDGKSGDQFIPRLWAMRKIAALQDQIRLHGEKRELKDEILKLAKKFGLMSMYTSFLVTEEEELRRRRPHFGGGPRDGRVPPTRSDRVMRKAAGGRGYARPKPGTTAGPAAEPEEKNDSGMREKAKKEADKMGQSGGEGAVGLSKKLNRQRRQLSEDDAEKEYGLGKKLNMIKHVGDKAFYNDELTWVDGEYDEKVHKDLTRVKYFSEEYFELLKKKPELSKYFALGSKVIVVLDAKAYQVSE
ncbi:MAG: VWA domain-containing protein [Planctomycetota bacterium]|nr:MAG: VWA domain-containing protein [Planctomycetota bacterium]